jgi:hypothetical protein
LNSNNYQNSITEDDWNACQSSNGWFSNTVPFVGSLSDLTVNVNTQNNSVASVTSNISGYLLGTGWTQLSVSNVSQSQGNISFKLKGAKHYSLFWNGIETIFAEQATYNVRVTCGGHLIIEEIFE